VLVLTMQAEEQYATRVLKMGGAGFLPKDSPPDQLLVALRKVGSGGRFVTPALAEKLIFHWEKKDTAPHEALSHREFLVMKLMAVGKPPKEIALELSISVKTVSTYRTRILAKLGCQSNAEMVRYCIEHQLIESGR
jgi:DNA-binding NarL/FixJ family response regulator